MNAHDDAHRFLQLASSIPWPEGLQQVGDDQAKILRLLESHELAADPAWVQSAREHALWTAHILARLDEDALEHRLYAVLSAMGALGIDAGTLGVMAARGVEREEISERDRELPQGLVCDMTRAGAEIFSRVLAAMDLLVTDQGQT